MSRQQMDGDGRSGGGMADLDATAEETGELGPLCRYSLLYWPEYQNFGIQEKASAQTQSNLSSGATSGLEYNVHYRAPFAPHIHTYPLPVFRAIPVPANCHRPSKAARKPDPFQNSFRLLGTRSCF